jgi:hypothetical protein
MESVMILKDRSLKLCIFLINMMLISSCNEVQFFQKEFLKGAGVDIDKEIEDTKILCRDASVNNSLSVYTETIYFPAAYECEFNENGSTLQERNDLDNGPRINGRITAREEQYFKVQLPENGKICDLDFEFPQQVMEYDDEILLLMNDFVVMSSTDYSTQSGSSHYDDGFEVNYLGLQSYKWLGDHSFYGLFYGWNVTQKYCLGLDSSMAGYDDLCSIPGTEQQGQIKLDIPNSKIVELSTVSGLLEGSDYTRSEINFGFVSTGDNDNGDCEHSAFSFDVSIKYIAAD